MVDVLDGAKVREREREAADPAGRARLFYFTMLKGGAAKRYRARARLAACVIRVTWLPQAVVRRLCGARGIVIGRGRGHIAGRHRAQSGGPRGT